MADVFISYSRRDKARVAPLVAAIQARGWSVWWDPEIMPGQEFDRLIDQELDAACAVLVVWTVESVQSRWVRGEARVAADRGVLVPVRYDAATLPIDVRALHTIDLDADSGPQRGIDDMLRALEMLIARGPQVRPQAVAVPVPAMPLAGGSERIGICVLPFANTGDSQQSWFSDGISSDIITELSRWQTLAVRSRAASFRYRGDSIDPQQVARELGVRFIVEGSVRRLGERIRINVQMIDAQTGSHAWAEKFDRAQVELFEVQDEVVRTIVATLAGRAIARDAQRARRKPSSSLAAYECVLEGNALNWMDAKEAAEAERLFQRAIELDPGYGLAHALLAAMRYGRWFDTPGSPAEELHAAFALSDRAVELDPNESTCFSILAQTCLLRGEFDLALQHVRRAIAINPGNQWNMADMGLVLVYLGQPEEALAWFRRARETDPFFDVSWCWRMSGEACLLLHRYDEALSMLARVSTPHYRVVALRAACHALRGDIEQAHAQAQQCLALKPDFSIALCMAKEPFQRQEDRELLTAGLRAAGLPD